MSRTGISINDLVNSQNQSPVNTFPSFIRANNQSFSQAYNPRNQPIRTTAPVRPIVEFKLSEVRNQPDDGRRITSINNSINEPSSSPDPLNCVSPSPPLPLPPETSRQKKTPTLEAGLVNSHTPSTRLKLSKRTLPPEPVEPKPLLSPIFSLNSDLLISPRSHPLRRPESVISPLSLDPPLLPRIPSPASSVHQPQSLLQNLSFETESDLSPLPPEYRTPSAQRTPNLADRPSAPHPVETPVYIVPCSDPAPFQAKVPVNIASPLRLSITPPETPAQLSDPTVSISQVPVKNPNESPIDTLNSPLDPRSSNSTQFISPLEIPNLIQSSPLPHSKQVTLAPVSDESKQFHPRFWTIDKSKLAQSLLDSSSLSPLTSDYSEPARLKLYPPTADTAPPSHQSAPVNGIRVKPTSFLTSKPNKKTLLAKQKASAKPTKLHTVPPPKPTSANPITKQLIVRRTSNRLSLKGSASTSSKQLDDSVVSSSEPVISPSIPTLTTTSDSPSPVFVLRATTMSSLSMKKSSRRSSRRVYSPREGDLTPISAPTPKDSEKYTPPLPLTPKDSANLTPPYAQTPEDNPESLPSAPATPKDDEHAFSDSSLTPPPGSQDAALAKHSQRKIAKSKVFNTKTLGVTGKNKGKEQEQGIPVQQVEEPFVPKKRGRPPRQGLPKSITTDLEQQTPTPTTERSTSPQKLTLKFNAPKAEAASDKPKITSNDEAIKAELASTSPVKQPNKKQAKKRKSESIESGSAEATGADLRGNQKENDKKPKISLKISKPKASRSHSPVPSKTDNKDNAAVPILAEDVKGSKKKEGDINTKTSENMGKKEVSDVSIPKKKGKGKRVQSDYSSTDSEEEEERIKKSKKKAHRVVHDEDEDEDLPKKKAGKTPKAAGEITKSEDPHMPKSTSISKTASNTGLTEGSKERLPSKSPDKRDSVQSSPPRAQQIKKKPRPSEPIKSALKKEVSAIGSDTPVNKSEGLARSKSTSQLVSSAEGSIKKPLPPKKPVPKPGQSGTPVPAVKASGHGIGLLGNTLALLQGTSTPKAKEGKDLKKETPKPVRRGGWTDEWVLTPEQEREFAASRPRREAERKEREEWGNDPVNLQEAKDIYRVDSMQSRTIAIPGAMGIQTGGKASAMVRALLGF
ncbi:uncharacterized protein IL334_005521 [Kwoniella shivajii]|uniref:Uncharacterized protein n=1 Tax=Kwoniella shivajii TaxID=564305 RepID=A0ABZ1D3D4_9TREE|nr:hypothetical protein IL334_005521 [Kwoniella shivajii]